MKVEAHSNIALIKYWGKNPDYEKYHVPTKSSLSLTAEALRTTTELETTPGVGKVELNLNGRDIPPDAKEFKKIKAFFDKLFEFWPEMRNYNYHIVSSNNFPTAAGFASSASGFAALAKALAQAFPDMEWARDKKKLSVIARLGSGSAARSIPGGVVLWHRGIAPDESAEPPVWESYAETIFPADHWPELRIIYVILNAGEKKISSRSGMKQTVQTSALYRRWIEHEESILLKKVMEAIEQRDLGSLVEVVMRASNGLHAVMLDTYPPIRYMTDESWRIVDRIHEFNDDGPKAAYTFDAGPNPAIITTEEHVSAIKELVKPHDVLVSKVI